MDLKLTLLIPHLSPSNWHMIVATYTTETCSSIYSSSSQHARLCYCLLSNLVVRVIYYCECDILQLYSMSAEAELLFFYTSITKLVLCGDTWKHSCFPSSRLWRRGTFAFSSLLNWWVFATDTIAWPLVNANYNNSIWC